jgi:hypothetical protein
VLRALCWRCHTRHQQHGLKRLHSLTSVRLRVLSALICSGLAYQFSTVSSTNYRDLSPNKGGIGTPLRKQRATCSTVCSQPHFNRRYQLRAHGVSTVPHRSSNDELLRHSHFYAASYTRDHGEHIPDAKRFLTPSLLWFVSWGARHHYAGLYKLFCLFALPAPPQPSLQ